MGFGSFFKSVGKAVGSSAKTIGKGVATGAKVVGKGIQKGATALANSSAVEKASNLGLKIGSGLLGAGGALTASGIGAPVGALLGAVGAGVSAGAGGIKGAQALARATSRRDLGEAKNAYESIQGARDVYKKGSKPG